MCYIHTFPDKATRSIVGNDLADCHLALFCDADFAGDKSACKSTTGVVLAVVGPSTLVPVAAISRKQSAVSLSTCESEIIAMITGLRDEALPILDLWEALPSDRKLSSDLIIFEDNQSTILVAEKGYSKQLRHLGRTHRVSLAWPSDTVIANSGKCILSHRTSSSRLVYQSFFQRDQIQSIVTT